MGVRSAGPGGENALGFAGLVVLVVFMITNLLNFVDGRGLAAGCRVRPSFRESLRSLYVTVLPSQFATAC